MSAISGIYYWDERPVSDVIITTMADASRSAGPDGGGYVSPRPGLVLQTNLLHFDRWSDIERQPWPFARGSVLTWDGRLDNREDLLMQLDRALGDERTDAAIVAAAYERWGLESLPKLIGDWSLALWDASVQRLILARDWIGNRPLYYLARPDFFAWASCLDALIDGCQLSTEPNETYIACRLSGNETSHVMPFNGVQRLPAGHYLLAAHVHALKVARYWTFSPATIVYRKSEALGERLRELFTEAVRVRLRTNRTIWSHLSGGWDSSTVVCLADRLIRNGGVEAPALETLTFRWADSPESNETLYVEAVERWRGKPTHYVDYFGYREVSEMLKGQRIPNGWKRVDTEYVVTKAGGRIVLTGQMGDALFLAPLYAAHILFDYLRRGRLLQFLRQTRALSLQARMPFFVTLVKSAAYLRKKRSRRIAKNVPGVSQKLLNMAREVRETAVPLPTTASLATRHFETNLYRYAQRGALVSSDINPLYWNTHPCTHRPLLEFLLAVEPAVLWNTTEQRASLASAMRDILPPETLARVRKGNAATGFKRAERRIIEALDSITNVLGPPARWHLVGRGYVDQDFLASLLAAPTSNPFFLTICIELESWLKTLEKESLPENTLRAVGSPGHAATSSAFATML